MHRLWRLTDGITTICSIFVFLFRLFTTIYCFSIGLNSLPLRFWNTSLTDGIITFRHTKAAHQVSFRVTIFLISWKQTQWAAYISSILFSTLSSYFENTVHRKITSEQSLLSLETSVHSCWSGIYQHPPSLKLLILVWFDPSFICHLLLWWSH